MTLVFPTFTREQFTLLVEASGAWLHHPRLAAEGLHAATPDQAADLAHLLLAAPQQPIVVVADDVGQEIRLDSMPLLRGMDRRRLIVRRVQQHFPGAPFAACIATQRDATQEKLMILHLPEAGNAPRCNATIFSANVSATDVSGSPEAIAVRCGRFSCSAP